VFVEQSAVSDSNHNNWPAFCITIHLFDLKAVCFDNIYTATEYVILKLSHQLITNMNQYNRTDSLTNPSVVTYK